MLYFKNVTLFLVTNVNVISFTFASAVQSSLGLFPHISQTLHSFMYWYLITTLTSVGQQMRNVWAEIYLQSLCKMWLSLRRFPRKSQALDDFAQIPSKKVFPPRTKNVEITSKISLASLIKIWQSLHWCSYKTLLNGTKCIYQSRNVGSKDGVSCTFLSSAECQWVDFRGNHNSM